MLWLDSYYVKLQRDLYGNLLDVNQSNPTKTHMYNPKRMKIHIQFGEFNLIFS